MEGQRFSPNSNQFEVAERGEPSDAVFHSCKTEYDSFSNEPLNKSVYRYEYTQKITLITDIGTIVSGLAKCTNYEEKEIDDKNCEIDKGYIGH